MTATPAERWIVPCVLECAEIARTIRLEPLERRHAPDLLAAADAELFRHTAQSPTEWTVAGFVEEMERTKAVAGVVALAVVLRENGRAIGRSTYMRIAPEQRGVEIGRTWIGRAHHGTRVNPEAKYLMLRHAFEALSPPAVRVQFTTNIHNVHSQAAIAKLGAVREGVLRRSGVLPAGLGRPAPVFSDWVMYSILDDEWPAAKARLEARLSPVP